MVKRKQQTADQSRRKYALKWAAIILPVVGTIIAALIGLYDVKGPDQAPAKSNSGTLEGVQPEIIYSEAYNAGATESSIAIVGRANGNVNNVKTGDNSPVTIDNGTGGQN